MSDSLQPLSAGPTPEMQQLPLPDPFAPADPAGAPFVAAAALPDRPPSPPHRRHRLPRGTGTVVTAVLAAVLASATTLTIAGLAGPGSAAGSAGTGAAGAGTTTATTVSATSSSSLASVIAAAEQSVVTVNVQTTVAFGRFGGDAQASGVGSGVIVSSNGYILTAQHVVEGASSVTVTTANGKTYDATVVGTSSTSDVALIKIDATGLRAAPIATGSPTVGEVVVAIGDPLGEYAGSATLGIVSGTDRTIQVQDATTGAQLTRTGLIQTDAALNEGNSGGPLLDSTGHVVGIATATSTSAQGLGFVTPISAAASLLSRVGVAAGA